MLDSTGFCFMSEVCLGFPKRYFALFLTQNDFLISNTRIKISHRHRQWTSGHSEGRKRWDKLRK